MFEAASDSEFGVASSGGFGRNKNLFTFTLEQGALPVSGNTPEQWTGLETIDHQVVLEEIEGDLPAVLEELGALPAVLEDMGALPAEVTSSEPKPDEGYESALSPESNHSLEANSDAFRIEDISNLEKFNFNLIFDNPIDEHNSFNIIDTNNPVGCPEQEQEPLSLYNDACFPMEEHNDPNWCPPSPEFTLHKIGVIEDPFLQELILGGGTGVKGKKPAGGVKHRRGQIRMEPTEMKDETHKKNVDR